jgi:hypothetical protein
MCRWNGPPPLFQPRATQSPRSEQCLTDHRGPVCIVCLVSLSSMWEWIGCKLQINFKLEHGGLRFCTNLVGLLAGQFKHSKINVWTDKATRRVDKSAGSALASLGWLLAIEDKSYDYPT